jgi:selenide,water dikinase
MPHDDPSFNAERLTSLAHGGGCGCKLAPSVLAEILRGMPQSGPFARLMVGTETADDAAVWRLNDDQALVATTDFFMPVVDDPFDFGRIAATNALSDVYAMGARPFLALALVGMPVSRLSAGTIQRILAGGASVCAAAGVPVAGGHSIDSLEPIYGLVALGLVHPDRILRNCTAQPGDVLVLTKGLGVGIFSAAFKQDRLDAQGYGALIDSTTRLNLIGPDLADMAGVHAATDVTGFGLLGHALEMARGSGLRARIDLTAVPLLPGARALAEAGLRTGAGGRNWASYGDRVDLGPAQPTDLDLLCDPQTSGGLLVACAPGGVDAVMALALAAGFDQTAVIGRLEPGEPGVLIVG